MRSAGPGPVHRLLYEDAMRRAARREVYLEEIRS